MHITVCRSIALHQGHPCSPRNVLKCLETANVTLSGGRGSNETAEGIHWVEVEGSTYPTEPTAAHHHLARNP